MAEQTLLQMVQNKCQKLGIGTPLTVIGNTNPTIAQMLQCLNEEVMEVANREYDFPRLKITTTFSYTSDANYIAVNMDTAASFGTGAFRSFVSDTLWDRTSKLKVVGPISDEDWATMLAMTSAPSYPVFRIVGQNLLIYPTNSSAHTYACDYMSKFAVQATAAGALKESFTVDTDVPLMPTRIVLAGFEWRWRQLKGQPYAEEMRVYEQFLFNEAGREINPGRVCMHNRLDDRVAGPGLLIAAGSWNL
jgi:hypothetical protein